MAGLSYMQRRTSGIYEFRKRLPQRWACRVRSESWLRGKPIIVTPNAKSVRSVLKT